MVISRYGLPYMATNKINIIQAINHFFDIHCQVLDMLDGKENSVQLNTQNISVSWQFHNDGSVGWVTQIPEPMMLPSPCPFGEVNDPFVQ